MSFLTCTKFWSAIVLTFISFALRAQNYTIDQSGPINTCSGTIRDNGGTGNYGANRNDVITICKDDNNPQTVLELVFTQFNVENNFDFFRIYDGNSTAAPQIGEYTGGNSPGTIQASGNCLTLQLETDGSGQRAGFAANISCKDLSVTPNCNPNPPSICADACDLGALKNPGNCPNSSVASDVFNLTNVGATPSNPYTFFTDCDGGDMSNSAADVWYRFTASSNIATFNVTGDIDNPQIAIYQGANCDQLQGRGCAIGNNSEVTMEVKSLAPGATYYLRVTGGDNQDQGDFILKIASRNDCDDCLVAANYNINPIPPTGVYKDGDVVEFCFQVTEWNETSQNWLHGVVPEFGPGWDLSTFQATKIPPSCDRAGQWGVYNSVTSSATGVTTGMGFYYDRDDNFVVGNPNLDGNPGNNFGDNCVGNVNFEFCFSIQVKGCPPNQGGEDLNVEITTYGDGESGGWTSPACGIDATYPFFAKVTCCPEPIVNVVNQSCPAECDGALNITGQGAPPFDYIVRDATNSIVFTATDEPGSISVQNLCEGDYSIQVFDFDGCDRTVFETVDLDFNGTNANAGANQSFCGDLGALAASLTTGSGGSWTQVSGPGTTTFAPNANVTNPQTQVSVLGTYTYRWVEQTGSCLDSAEVTINYNTVPTADAGINRDTCGLRAKLLASFNNVGMGTWTQVSGPGTTNFLPNANDPQATAEVSTHGAYVYRWTIVSNGCEDFDDVNVNFGDAPDADAGPDVTICEGETANLTASGGIDYTWSNGATTASTSVQPTTTTDYIVTVSKGVACVTTDTVKVIVTLLANINVSNDTTICAESCVEISAEGGATYLWSTGETTATINVCPTANTNYSVTVNPGNCEVVEDVQVDLFALPAVAVQRDTAICFGDDATLRASGAVNYLWSTGSNQPNIVVSPTENTTYEVTGTDVNGCTATSDADVTVNPLPIAELGADTGICSGDVFELVANGGVTYNWSNGVTGADQSVTINQDSTFSVTVTDANGCVASESIQISEKPLPIANAGADEAICLNDCIDLTASGGDGYEWSNGDVIATTNVCPTQTTIYEVTVSLSGCTATDEVEVVVNDLPTLTGNDAEICDGDCTNLTVNGAQTYLWSTNQTGNTINVCPTADTAYTVVGTDGNGCEASKEFAVIVHPLPNISAGPDDIICKGDSKVLTGTGGVTYQWSTNEQTNPITISPVNFTIYGVTGTDANGCVNSDIVEIDVIDEIQISFSGNQNICAGDQTTLTVQSNGNIQWSIGSTSDQITVAPLADTYYKVTATAGSCLKEDSVLVIVRQLPVITFNPAQPEVCEFESIQIQAQGGNQYQWNTGDNTGSILFNAAQSDTTLNVEVLGANGCVNDRDLNIQVHAYPTAKVLSGGGDHCGTEAQLVAQPSVGNGSWTKTAGPAANINLVNGTHEVTTQITDYVAYQFTWQENNNGCIDDTTITATFYEIPVANAGNGNNVCITRSQLSAIPSVGVGTWSQKNGVGNSTIAAPNNPLTDVDVDAYGGYTYTWKEDNNGCTSESDVQINYFIQPVANAGISDDICGKIYPLKAVKSVANSVGVWKDVSNAPGVSFSNVNDENAIGTANTEAVYNLRWTENNNGCIDSADIVITYLLIPSPVITPDVAPICNGDVSNLTASGAQTYVWSVGSQNSAVQVSPSNTTSYEVTATANNGCTATASYQLVVNQNPTATITPPDNNICLNDEEDLIAHVVAGTGLVFNFQWSSPTNSVLSANAGDKIQFNASNLVPNSQHQVDLLVTDDNGCVSTDSKVMTVRPLPTAHAGRDLEGCNGLDVILGANQVAQGGNGPYTYKWSSSNLLSDANLNKPRFNTNQVGAFDFVVTVTDAYGCTATDSMTATSNPLPEIRTSEHLGCVGSNVELSVDNPKANHTYYWSTNNVGPKINVLFVQPTVHRVTVVGDITGCSNEAEVPVNERILDVVIGVDQSPAIAGDSVILFAESDDAEIYQWQPADLMLDNLGPETALIPLEDVKIQLSVIDAEGCRGYAERLLPVKILPEKIAVTTAFTPNGDGINDFAKVFAKAHVQISNFVIYNRWGEAVFDYPNTNPEPHWSGHYKGKLQPQDVYSYLIKAYSRIGKQQITEHGNITLMK